MTYDGEGTYVVDWTVNNKILYSTRKYSTLPIRQLVEVDVDTKSSMLIPLSQASDGDFNKEGTILYFTRLPFQGCRTKRYKGGSVENIWKYELGGTEALLLPLKPGYMDLNVNG